MAPLTYNNDDSDDDFNSIYGSDVESDDNDNEDEVENEDDVESVTSQLQTMKFAAVSTRAGSTHTKLAGPPLCAVCHKRPAYSQGGKSYPTCGLTCAAAYKASGSTHSSGHGTGQSSRGSGRGSRGAHSSGSGQQGHSKLMCVICGIRPCYRNGAKTYITCGLTCAGKLCAGQADPTKCNYCHRRPRFQNYLQCGKTCRDRAKVACLLCRSRPRNGRYHLCGKSCRDISVKTTPLILEVPSGHDTFTMVESRFKKGWKAPGAPPTIKKVYKIIENKIFLSPYDAYRKSHGGTENFCYHGTSRQCTLGNAGNTTLCTSTSCALCSILRTSFKVSLANNGLFGRGIYSSTAANKAHGYSSNGVMLLTKVVVGRSFTATAYGQTCPTGYDSVIYSPGGILNETIVYNDSAIRPVFLILV